MPPVVPRPRPHVQQVVCLSDHLKIVFDHDDRVAQVPQPLEGADETVRIAGVQADGWVHQERTSHLPIQSRSAMPAECAELLRRKGWQLADLA